MGKKDMASHYIQFYLNEPLIAEMNTKAKGSHSSHLSKSHACGGLNQRIFAYVFGVLMSAALFMPWRAQAQCPKIPGFEPVRSLPSRFTPVQGNPSTCACTSGGVIVRREGGQLGCTSAKQFRGPNSGRFPYGIIVAPGSDCPYKTPARNSAEYGGSKWCEEYCSECLGKDYGADWWSDVWGAFNALTQFLEKKVGLDLAQGNDQLRYEVLGKLGCLAEAIGYLLPALQEIHKGGDWRSVLGTINPLTGPNMGNLLCALPACFDSLLKANVGGVNPILATGELQSLSIIMELLCSFAFHSAHVVDCEAKRWQCETDLYGNQPIPNCVGIANDPIWRGYPIQWPVNAALDCCLAQVTHVYPWCQFRRNEAKCQEYLNRCLSTVRGAPTPTPTPEPSGDPEYCPVMLTAKYCPRCPTGRCATPLTSDYCWVENGELTGSQVAYCEKHYEARGFPKCSRDTVCELS